ncbi:MAG: toxin-antitoxin system YwqK family antitoxin [Cyclobacteriaceae bacterium]
MKGIIVLLMFTALAACDSTSVSDNGSPIADASLPVGAVTEQFNDGSGLTKVTVNDGAGNLSESGVLRNGKREGNWIEYHPNGLIKTASSYVDGQLEGVKMELSNSGQLEKRMNYHLGQLDGEYKEFRYSTLKEERYYVGGKLEGTTKIYYDNGKVMEEGAYKNGTRDGVSKWYDQEGNVTIEYEYKNGELVKK